MGFRNETATMSLSLSTYRACRLGTLCFAQPTLLCLKKKAGESSPACLVIMPSLLFLHLRAPVLVLEIVFLHELVEHLLLCRLDPSSRRLARIYLG